MDTTPDTEIDPSRCPLCGAPNRCAMEAQRRTGQPQGPCWCVNVRFPAALLDQVPPAARGKACVCEACARRFSDPAPLTRA